MSKKSKISAIDFHFGIGEITPSTQEAYRGEFEGAVRKVEKEQLTQFKKTLGQVLDEQLKDNEQFPSDREIFIFIIQYFVSEKEYKRRDIDNMAKTILDTLKNRFYRDDSQVKTLLVGKKIEQRIPQNFAYVAIQQLAQGRDADVLKISGIERSITLFQELKSKGIL
ncbi:MAG: RusA family crossover junction endodeoxyribonuclease [Parcubacteria group bacterium]|nr:RusA family crossover junction endodeoxyribonuclease [Parcubacteria group bacterium]